MPDLPSHSLPSLSRRSDVPSFSVMETMALARQLEAEGHSIIHMEAGEPGLGTPKPAIEAAIRAMEEGGTGYTQTPGLPALRERIATL
ncbi:MAG: aminotransferase, partial [Alphaproteobacteria bacterium]|nr:aminotransferase [Alphaproteobacteria bacterium]